MAELLGFTEGFIYLFFRFIHAAQNVGSEIGEDEYFLVDEIFTPNFLLQW